MSAAVGGVKAKLFVLCLLIFVCKLMYFHNKNGIRVINVHTMLSDMFVG